MGQKQIEDMLPRYPVTASCRLLNPLLSTVTRTLEAGGQGSP